jgi:hypothetical protein
MIQSPENTNTKQENNVELHKSEKEHLESIAINDSLENYRDNNNLKIESARKTAIELATNSELKYKKTESIEDDYNSKRGNVIDKSYLDKSYKRTIKQAQNSLNPTEKVFSKIIHNDVIDRASDIIGNTILKPNPILFGSFSAFIITLLTYLIAKSLGYQLSGFESIFAFAAGWIIGILFDYLKIIITGKK